MKNINLREILPSRFSAGIAGFFTAVIFVIAGMSPGQAQAAVGINKMVNFQGKVVNTNGTNVTDASYTFRFRIYTGASGDATNSCAANTCVWEESKSIATVNGIFQTYLGDTTVFPGSVDFNSDNLYLGVVFNGDTEMSPRIRLSAVPYAFNASRLGGLDSSAFVQLSPSSQQSGFINVSGNVTSGGTIVATTALQAPLLDTATAVALNIGTTNATGISLNQNTSLAANKTLTVSGATLISTDNASALRVQAATGGLLGLHVDTANKVTYIGGTLEINSVINSGRILGNAGNGSMELESGNDGDSYIDFKGSSNLNTDYQGRIGYTDTTGYYVRTNASATNALSINTNGSAFFKGNSDQPVGFQVQNSANYGVLTVDTSAGRIGIATGNNALSYSLEVNGDTGIAGNLYMGSGATRTITVATPTSGAGNDLYVKGGNSASGNNNGANLVLSGGLGSGTGSKGVIMLDTPAFTTVTNTSCSSNCTISQANIDNNSAVIITSTAPNVTITMPDPTNQTAGRVVYVTGGNGSADFALAINSGGSALTIAMRQNSTATMIWNGSDWTAAGASSSTDLQSAYDNTLASAGGAEILLNNTATSNGLTIRNNSSNPILGSVFEVQSSVGTNFFSVNANAVEYAVNGGGETTPFNTGVDWASVGAGTVNRYTSNPAYYATGQASVEVNTPAAINTGVRNKLSANLAANTKYQVSLTGKLPSGTFTTLDIQYTRDGSTLTSCSSYSTQTLTTNGWSKVTCVFTTPATAATASSLVIRQTDATARSFYIDNLSVTLSTTTSSPPNVQIGGGSFGGAVTLFTLDKSSSPPVASGNDVYYGSMYYDTTSGRIQCYQANGWGACGSAPDTFINLVPEYGGAVLNGSGVGTMTADFCSNQASVLMINQTLCNSGQALNYYKWTSPQASQQTYSIYISYQLPGGFKNFQSDSTVQLTARTDNTSNGAVTYEMYRSESGALTACGTETSVTSIANTWETVQINGNESAGCGFTTASANNFAIFKINVKAKSNANVYVGALSFTITNQ